MCTKIHLKRKVLKSVILLFLFLLLNFSCGLKLNAVATLADTIKIGLLIPDKQSLAAKDGAELAVLNANKKESSGDHYYKLELRDMEGPWGMGSKVMVDLVFNEKVWAVLGSVNGRNSHLAEQVSAKSHVVFLNALSGDPTLSQAFVPWYFSCLPNDLQQGSILTEQLSSKKAGGKIAVVSGGDYDSKLASESFMKKAVTLKSEIQVFSSVNSPADYSSVIHEISKTDIRYIIIFLQPAASVEFMNQLKLDKIKSEISGPLPMMSEMNPEIQKELEGITFISPGFLLNNSGLIFSHEFMKQYGYLPGPVAAFAFDGMNLLIEAVKKTAGDRDKVQESLMNSDYDGITGRIQFDERGNRKGNAGLLRFVNGKPVAVDKN